MSHAEGAYKWDVDGHRYIDYVVGHGALLLGHSHPEIVAAVQQQVARGTHLGAGNEYEIEWAELVQRLIPSADLVKFTSSGTEATMMAMRLARAYTGRDKVLKFAGHFHGWHDYATVAQQLPYDGSPSPGVPAATLSSVVVAPNNDLDFVEARLAEGDIAAVITEASGASWSSIPQPPGYLQRLRAITEKARRRLDLRRSDHRFPLVAGRRAGEGRRHARSDDDGEGARRWPAGRGGGGQDGDHGSAHLPRRPGLEPYPEGFAPWHLQRQSALRHRRRDRLEHSLRSRAAGIRRRPRYASARRVQSRASP